MVITWPEENSRHVTRQVKSYFIISFLQALQENFEITSNDLWRPLMTSISKPEKPIARMAHMPSMLEPNSNANHSKLVEHVRTKLFDEFVNMIWREVDQEQTNSLWSSQMVHQQSHQEQPVKQGHFKIQAGFQTDVVMTSSWRHEWTHHKESGFKNQ